MKCHNSYIRIKNIKLSAPSSDTNLKPGGQFNKETNDILNAVHENIKKKCDNFNYCDLGSLCPAGNCVVRYDCVTERGTKLREKVDVVRKIIDLSTIKNKEKVYIPYGHIGTGLFDAPKHGPEPSDIQPAYGRVGFYTSDDGVIHTGAEVLYEDDKTNHLVHNLGEPLQPKIEPFYRPLGQPHTSFWKKIWENTWKKIRIFETRRSILSLLAIIILLIIVGVFIYGKKKPMVWTDRRKYNII